MNNSIPEVNETAPDFSVAIETGDDLSLKQVLETGNHVLLLFYRGHW